MAKETLNQEFLAWLAGFWEGEGSLTVYKKKGRARISITQADRIPLDLIKEKLGVGGVYHNSAREGCRAVYQWEVGGRRNVVMVMSKILPFLKFRRAEAERKIMILKEKKNSGITWTHDEDDLLRQKYLTIGDKELAKALGRSLGAIYMRRIDLGLHRLKRYDWKAFKRDYLSGKKMGQISEIYGADTSTVSRALKRMGLTSANATQSSNV